jgi:hypothetical protein
MKSIFDKHEAKEINQLLSQKFCMTIQKVYTSIKEIPHSLGA